MTLMTKEDSAFFSRYGMTPQEALARVPNNENDGSDRAERYCWLGFGERSKCPNMCTGRLCGYAKS
jgi:hypothetical protein